MKAKAGNRRTRELARIHVGAKKLGMDRTTYQAFLKTTAGVDSAGDLDQRGRTKVIDRLHHMGLPKPVKSGKPRNTLELSGEIEKIEAQLADMRLPWSYADSIGAQMFGVARVGWLRKPGQLRAVLAALHVEQEKRAGIDAIDSILTSQGKDRAWLETQLQGRLPESWHRKRECLRWVVAWLDFAFSLGGNTHA